jgi:phage/plasmid-associated DNA primase
MIVLTCFSSRFPSGNGKGVVKQMLGCTLGEYFGVMVKDAVVKPPEQRPPSKGAATGYLAELQGKRVAITDETSPGERVDLGLVLGMTGGGQVSARLLYRNNVMFPFFQTPFIQTNYDPEIPSTLAKQPNVQRRLIVVQFPNEYVFHKRFDETNPRHRRVDIGLKERMETPAVREEFLTFLAQGGVAYYANPKVLRAHPAAIEAATAAWFIPLDKLQTFLRSKHVTVGDDKVAWEDELWSQFQMFAGIKKSKEALCRQTGEKGYARTKKGGRFDGDPSKRVFCYQSLAYKYQ